MGRLLGYFALTRGLGLTRQFEPQGYAVVNPGLALFLTPDLFIPSFFLICSGQRRAHGVT